MRKLLILSILIIGFQYVSGQSFYTRPEIFYMPGLSPEKFYEDRLNNNISDNPGLQYRLQTGMLFSSLSGFNSFTSFVSPKVFLPIGSRFAVEVGTTFTSTSFPGQNSDTPDHINSLLTYARGVFSINENLTVYGEVAKSFKIGESLYDTNFESFTMGMEYWVTPNFRIGASFTQQNGFDPFNMASPYRYGYPGYRY